MGVVVVEMWVDGRFTCPATKLTHTHARAGASLFLGSALSVLALVILQVAFVLYDHHDQHK